MKATHIIYTAAVAMTLTACGGNGNNESTGTKFAPMEKQSSLSESERSAAIAEKKASLAFSVDSILNYNGVKFSVMPPATGDGVTAAAAERLTTKIIAIAARNGIGGLAVNPVLGLVTKVDRTESALTATAPQKTIARYELTFYCGNFVSNDIYASASVTVTGVGADLDAATLQAFGELKDTPAIAEMLRTASARAMEWYNDEANISVLVDQAVAEQNYALAMALLASVPAHATTHEYAAKRNAEVSDMFFQSKADELFSNMTAAIAASEGIYNPAVGAYYCLIPHNSKIWPEADKAFAEYCKTVDSDRRDALARARSVEDRDARDAQLLAMERLEVEKIKAPYEAQAAIAQIEADARVGVAQANAEGKKNANTGGFLGLGKLWDGGFGLANRLLDNIMDD